MGSIFARRDKGARVIKEKVIVLIGGYQKDLNRSERGSKEEQGARYDEISIYGDETGEPIAFITLGEA